MNIMIMSPGRRVEIVEFFKEELNKVGGNVYTLDMNPNAAAMFYSNQAYCVEKDFDNLDDYMNRSLELCKQLKVDCVLTLIDPELPLLALYKSRFEEFGINVMISDIDLVDATFDKLAFYEFFKDTLPVVWTTGDKETLKKAIECDEIKFPIFAKPQNGSGSAGLTNILNMDELNSFEPKEEYIYQPFSKKKEFGVDMYFNLENGKLEQYFIKEKISMRSGETDKSISVHNDSIKDIIMKLDGKGFRGTIDMDVFLGFDGRYYVNEINPRFGGGYPHAYHCGMNYIKDIIMNLQHKDLQIVMDDYPDGIMMMKYNNYHFIDRDDVSKYVKSFW